MNIRKITSRRGAEQRRQPMWLRVVAFFAMVLIGAVSTAQLCHSHDDASPAKSSLVARSVADSAGDRVSDSKPGKSNPDQDDSGSRVRCPLCVAMHSALPVTGHLPEVALLALVAMVPMSRGTGRSFSWRFEMASRPPPAALSLA